MAWTEEGYDRQVLAPRRAAAARLAEEMERQALHTRDPIAAHRLRAQAMRLAELAAEG